MTANHAFLPHAAFLLLTVLSGALGYYALPNPVSGLTEVIHTVEQPPGLGLEPMLEVLGRAVDDIAARFALQRTGSCGDNPPLVAWGWPWLVLRMSMLVAVLLMLGSAVSRWVDEVF